MKPQPHALPLHLNLLMLPWLSARLALQASSSDFSCSNITLPPCLPAPLKQLFQAWDELKASPELAQAVESETLERLKGLIKGLENYKYFPASGQRQESETVLSIGAARLLDFGRPSLHAPVVFLIPSLINRYYILDLNRKLSFARYLKKQNIHVFIVDWGSYSAFERHFNAALYVTEILVQMNEYIRHTTQTPVTVAGYCMGGLLALALASIRPDLSDRIACFSTPWDFFAPAFPRIALEEQQIKQLRDYIDQQEDISSEAIHTLFHYANPCAFHNKLREFAAMDANDSRHQDFLAIEQWVNDGVPMTKNVGLDCLVNWTQYNQPANLSWRVGGHCIDPRKLSVPVFVAAPLKDTIVPYDCAIALAPLLQNASIVTPNSGHISMMVGKKRKSELWEPFVEWVLQKSKE